MKTIDYYKILQVHYQAEPEIIETAYKRLARKYHPDVNPNMDSVEKMQLINEAYTILSDPLKRKEYNRVWEEKRLRPTEYNPSSTKKNENDFLFLSAKAMIEDYFSSIMNGKYEHCYELISEADKSNISKEEFIRWQEAVSKVYCIKKFQCEIYGVYRDKLIQGVIYSNALEFSIHTVEYNIVMDMLQKDNFNKLILYQGEQWRIFLGYEKLEPLINKFNDLKGLLNAKNVLNELVENHSKVDNTTGLINQRGLLEQIEREFCRKERYGNVFSLLLCDIEIIKLMNADETRQTMDYVIMKTGELLKSKLRKLDIIGRWNNDAVMVILPETGLMAAIKATHKIQRLLKEANFNLKDKECRIIAGFGVTEYHSSLEETLDRIYHQLK